MSGNYTCWYCCIDGLNWLHVRSFDESPLTLHFVPLQGLLAGVALLAVIIIHSYDGKRAIIEVRSPLGCALNFPSTFHQALLVGVAQGYSGVAGVIQKMLYVLST